MSVPRDPRSADVAPPTSVLPLVRPAGSRHRAPDDGRRLMWLATGGAAAVMVAAVLVVVFAGGEEAGPATGGTVAIGTSAPAEPSEPVTGEVSPTPTSSSSPTSPAPRSASPAQLVAGLRTSVDGLIRQRQLSRGEGNELRKRLREVAEKIADGEADKARENLREFAEKLVNLRREGKISASGYEALAAGATQLGQALPGR
ncbi:FIMAH domain-containing protein [Micromonospora sp. IBSANI012]|uniref:FIMAH domain-containing protein n=1 Tax=Micromonospora sp. IBSANI012 TaxID=3457761 RepID=UPI00405A32A4